MATHSIHIPDHLLAELQSKAAEDGKTVDEVAAEALGRYLQQEWLDRMEREGLERRKHYGLKTDDDIHQFVEHAIDEDRRKR